MNIRNYNVRNYNHILIVTVQVRIGIGIETAHLNEEFWDKPLEFMPERFENNNKQHPFAYMPFSLKSRAW
ncbi:cytochrome P450 [Brasilonema sp. CT11]|nr:cytochrome P450 [Brasilonema sp. CT11]